MSQDEQLDILCSHALNNMTINELAHTYADLKLRVKFLVERRDAALRALDRISNYIYGVDVNARSPQQIAQDAIEAEKRLRT
jgi:hypothetical protein